MMSATTVILSLHFQSCVEDQGPDNKDSINLSLHLSSKSGVDRVTCHLHKGLGCQHYIHKFGTFFGPLLSTPHQDLECQYYIHGPLFFYTTTPHKDLIHVNTIYENPSIINMDLSFLYYKNTTTKSYIYCAFLFCLWVTGHQEGCHMDRGLWKQGPS